MKRRDALPLGIFRDSPNDGHIPAQVVGRVFIDNSTIGFLEVKSSKKNGKDEILHLSFSTQGQFRVKEYKASARGVEVWLENNGSE